MLNRHKKYQKTDFSTSYLAILCAGAIFVTSNATAQESIYTEPTPWEEVKSVRDNDSISKTSLYTKDHLTNKDTPNTNMEYDGTEDTPSRIEGFYATRIVDELEQYGYELFNNKPLISETSSGGVNQESVIIGIGDTLNIVLRGQINDRQDYTISPQGLLIIDNFAPVSVIGLTVKQLQDRLSLEAENLINTEVFVTLKTIRKVGVTVAGHVESPGRHILTATHTIMDALQIAGGIKKTGSLRKIKLSRNGDVKIIDLYGLLQNGTSRADIPLREGDKIIVPSVGSTLAIAGDVKNPAIYELPSNNKYSLAALFALSGGLISPSEYRFIKLGVNKHGQEITQDITNLAKRQFGDGSILIVSRRQHSRKGAIEVKGTSNTQGIHDIRKAKSLSSLLPDRESFTNDVYPLVGLIERWDEKNLSPTYISFSPIQIVDKDTDINLQQSDKVHLFSREDIASLSSEDMNDDSIDKKTSEKQRLLNTILKEHSVYIRGAVRQVGSYPIHKGTQLKHILPVAGGYTLEADKNSIEITENRDGEVIRQNVTLSNLPEEDLILQPGDTIRVNKKSKALVENSVHLYGEVKSPGRYDLMNGDTLLSLLERAGGVLEHSYPEGTIFSRKSERKREENRYKAQARDLELKLASILEGKDKPDKEQVRSVETLIRDLRNAKAVGRITVESDPEILDTKPELNILLEDGDKIYIPKRPLTVRVAGEILSPSALQFRSEKDPSEYIREAGGYSYYADKGRAFVILPDGSAQPLKVNYWNHQASFIPPGSTIIVPRDPKPFDLVESAKDISQIVANLAVTAVLADEIGDDD